MSSQSIATSTVATIKDIDPTSDAEDLQFLADPAAIEVPLLLLPDLAGNNTETAPATTDNSGDDVSPDNELYLSAETNPIDDAPDALIAKLAHLVQSVTEVEELSRRAREAAVSDFSRYQALAATFDQYNHGLDQAGAILDQARQALDRSFGQAARSAAEVLVVEADQVVAAFAKLVTTWQEQATTFLGTHPDVELLVAEQRAQEAEGRRQEALAALARRRDALLAGVDAALEQRVLPEARRALALFEREFADETEAIHLRHQRVQQAIREARDMAAQQAMLLAAEQQARGDFEAAVATLEQVEVRGLSLEISQDVFGRWCDACSRLAQTTGAYLLRDAPDQGRGLILVVDPARTTELQIFSSLGMGPDYPAGATITPFLSEEERRDPSACRRAMAAPKIVARARGFREATPLPVTSWATFATPATAPAPIHH